MRSSHPVGASANLSGAGAIATNRIVRPGGGRCLATTTRRSIPLSLRRNKI